MGHPGMRPLTGRAPAPTNSEGFSEPHPTTDRAVDATGSVPLDVGIGQTGSSGSMSVSVWLIQDPTHE